VADGINILRRVVMACTFLSSILQDDVESVDDSRDPTKDCQQDVDEEVCITASLKEHT